MKETRNMEKMSYTGLELEVMELGPADVIVASGPDGNHPDEETPERDPFD